VPAITRPAREGTIVNARSPAPAANRMAVGHRLVDAVMGALAGAAPASYRGVSDVYAFEADGDDGERSL